jgi:hypothetical protein
MTYHGYVTRLIRRVSLVEQELLILPEHLSSPSVFSGVRVTRSLVLYVCFVDRCLSFSTFSFGHCVVCSSIYGFWLPLWYLQTCTQQTQGVNSGARKTQHTPGVNSGARKTQQTTGWTQVLGRPNKHRGWTQVLGIIIKFEDTKGVIRIRISKNRQHNGQKKKY